jgi:hypothetical protein
MLMSQTYRVHGFGLSITGVGAFRQYLESADSSAWSFAASKQERLRGCTHPGKCNNCLRFALRWRKKVINAERTRHPETHHCTCDTCQDDGRRSTAAIEASDNTATAALLNRLGVKRPQTSAAPAASPLAKRLLAMRST